MAPATRDIFVKLFSYIHFGFGKIVALSLKKLPTVAAFLDSTLQSGRTIREDSVIEVEKKLAEMAKTFAERRKEIRLNIRVPVTVSGIHPSTMQSFVQDTCTTNVSLSGANIEISRGYLREGMTVHLSVRDKFNARATVVWVKESSEGKATAGLEFHSTEGQWVIMR